MESQILGGFFSAANLPGFGRVFRKLTNSSVFPANPNVVHVNPVLPGANPNLFNVNPHVGFSGGNSNSRNGSGSGGDSGGHGGENNKHNHGDDDHSRCFKRGLVLLGITALFQGLDEGKLSERKLVYVALSFLISQWVLTTPLACAHATKCKDEGVIHAQDSDGMEQKNEGDDSMRSEETPRIQAGRVHSRTIQAVDIFTASLRGRISCILWGFSRDNQELSANPTDLLQVDAMYGDIPINDQINEPFVEGFDALNVDGSREQAQPEKESSIRRNGHNKEANLSSMTASDHPLQRVMGWLEQVRRPAFADEQVQSFESTAKVEQMEQQGSRVLFNEGATPAPKVDYETGGKPLGAKQSDIDTLKRLQREAFSELMKLRTKLEKLEQVTQAGHKLERLGAARTQLKGLVKAGSAFVVLEDENSRHSRGSLERAGMQTGLNVRFTFETPFRESDVLITQVLSGQCSSVGGGRALGGPLRLGKLHYVAQVNDDISLSFVPLGAQGQDVTEIVNVLQDQGLTSFSSQGPALFDHCKGSALGATVSGSKFAFSFGQYLSGWGNHVSSTETVPEEPPLSYSTLCQILFQPTEGFILSFCGLNRYWPTPPLPSSMALHWSELGPLVFPRIKPKKADCSTMLFGASSGPHTQLETLNLECDPNTFESRGTRLLTLAVSSSLDLGETTSISGWAQVERGDLLQDPDKGNLQWALCLANTPERGIGWGASIGGSRHDLWHMSSSSYDDYSGYDEGDDVHGPQLHIEAFLKLSCGRGFTLQPGLLYVSNKSSHTPAFVVRSSWSL